MPPHHSPGPTFKRCSSSKSFKFLFPCWLWNLNCYDSCIGFNHFDWELLELMFNTSGGNMLENAFMRLGCLHHSETWQKKSKWGKMRVRRWIKMGLISEKKTSKKKSQQEAFKDGKKVIHYSIAMITVAFIIPGYESVRCIHADFLQGNNWGLISFHSILFKLCRFLSGAHLSFLAECSQWLYYLKMLKGELVQFLWSRAVCLPKVLTYSRSI